jgi:hypothetical protein
MIHTLSENIKFICMSFSNKVESESLASFSSLFCHVPYKAFLVPDSCRATERNGNSISTDITEDTNGVENFLNSVNLSYIFFHE